MRLYSAHSTIDDSNPDKNLVTMTAPLPRSASNSPFQPTLLSELTEFVLQPSHAFTAGIAAQEHVRTQIWRAPLTERELWLLLRHTRALLAMAIDDHCLALGERIAEMKEQKRELGTLPEYHDWEDLKGDVCVAVLRRWEHEKMLYEINGRQPQWVVENHRGAGPLGF